jgi:hypothetical protein
MTRASARHPADATRAGRCHGVRVGIARGTWGTSCRQRSALDEAITTGSSRIYRTSWRGRRGSRTRRAGRGTSSGKRRPTSMRRPWRMPGCWIYSEGGAARQDARGDVPAEGQRRVVLRAAMLRARSRPGFSYIYAPAWTRTRDLRLRRPLLYPAELLAPAPAEVGQILAANPPGEKYRDGQIRTGDPLVPNQVRYRTAPRPVQAGPKASGDADSRQLGLVETGALRGRSRRRAARRDRVSLFRGVQPRAGRWSRASRSFSARATADIALARWLTRFFRSGSSSPNEASSAGT